jgi:hypothetical protein
VAPYPGQRKADLAAYHVGREAAYVSKRLTVEDAGAGLAADHAPRLATDHAAETLAEHPGRTQLAANPRRARLAAEQGWA